MSIYSRGSDKRRIMQEYSVHEDEIVAVLGRQSSMSPKNQLENDKKIRREIANSNERRRMQSINAGFQSLRTLIPHHEGEKLSKAAILQQTSEYIHNLEQEKTKLLAQNENFKRLLSELSSQNNMVECELSLYGSSPPTKRKKRDTESSDEGITADYDDYNIDEVRREMIELRHQLDRERRHRMMLEDRARHLESRFYNEGSQHLTNHFEEDRQDEKEVTYMDVVKEEVKEIHSEPDHQLPPSPPPKSETSECERGTKTSMSRRNLETIVEAIRHLEGDRIPLMSENNYEEVHHAIPNSEESEKESSITTSDMEDFRSESSGRDSPDHFVQDRQSPSSTQISQNNFHQKYPIATNLLHGPVHQHQYYYRPGVIVQKS